MGSGYTPPSGKGTDAFPNYIAPGGPAADAFSRLRTSQAVQLFSGVRDYARGGGSQFEALRYDSSTTGGGTVVAQTNRASSLLTVTDTQNDEAVLQTKEYFLYRAGQSQLDIITFVMGSATPGIRKRVGLFDADDGIFLEQTEGGTLRFVIRSSVSGAPVETAVSQPSWSLDRLDGTGASGVTLDISLAQILVIDLQFLGVGRVRIGFDIMGVIIYAHEFDHANETGNTSVYMRSATLPIRYEITAVGALPASGDSLEAICAQSAREGSDVEPGVQTVVKATSARTATSVWRMALAVRLRSAAIRGSMREFVAKVLNTDITNSLEWQFVVNPTIASTTTPTYANVHTTTSIAEWSQTAGVRINDGSGHRILHGYSPAANRGGSGTPVSVSEDLPLVADIAGTADVGILAVRAISATAACWSSLTWRELY